MSDRRVPAVRLEGEGFAAVEGATDGSYRFGREGDQRYIVFLCPCGCRSQYALPIRVGAQGQGKDFSWGWDGNEQSPTLTPSIRVTRMKGLKCAYHGHLDHGVWTFERDSGT